MKQVLKAGAVFTAAEVLNHGDMIGNVIDHASARAENIADYLEEIDKSIPDEEETND